MGYKHLPPLVMPRNEGVLGYVAGIIDGEGCIGITQAFDAKKSRRMSHYIRASICNTDPRLLQWFQQHFGGKVSRHTASSRKRHWKAVYYWQISGQRAENFIEAIRPWLIIKREQADLMLAFRQIGRHRGGGQGRGGAPLPDHVVSEREELKAKMHILNARGA